MPSAVIPPVPPRAQPDAEATGEYRPPKLRFQSDRYALSRFHARGGMGEIWLAEDLEIGRSVALKKMRSGRDEDRERFLIEAQTTGQLEHPGIVPVHELGVDEHDQPFYVMKSVDGRTLKEAIAEYHAPAMAAGSPSSAPREVQWLRLLEIFVDLCHAISYAHSRGVLHRDLKPENVMLGRFGETLVLDWGLAKVLNYPETAGRNSSVHLVYGDSSHTQAGSVIGSAPYMAPEVAEGRAEQTNERTDIYLLGATLCPGHPHRLAGRGTNADDFGQHGIQDRRRQPGNGAVG